MFKYVEGGLETTMVVDTAMLGSALPVVRSLDMTVGRLLVGTLGAEIFELSSYDGANTSPTGGPLLQALLSHINSF